MHLKQLVFATALSTLLFGAMSSWAEEPQQSHDGYTSSPQAVEVDDATVSRLATAMSEVQQIQQALSQQLRGVEDQLEARELQLAAQQQMVSAVEASGVSVDEYNQITNQMASDPQLRQRIMDELSQL